MRYLLPILVLLSSCTVEANLRLLPTGAVEVQGLLSPRPAALTAWKNLREVDPTLPSDPLAPSVWKSGLGPRSSVAVTPAGTTLHFTVDEPKKFVPSLRSSAHEWTLVLDRAAIRSLAALSAWGQSPALDSLIPAPGASVTESDYRDLLAYFLGPSLDAKAATALIDASTVTLTVVAPSPIVSAPGAQVDGDRAVYRWPLVKILALTTPIRLQLNF